MHEKFTRLPAHLQSKIKRAKLPEDLLRIGAFYGLVESVLEPENKKQLARVVFMMPHVSSTKDSVPFAERMAQKNISELRVLQLQKLRFPNDLLNLRRIAIQIKTAVDWDKFGNTVFYWGRFSKKRLIEDYILKKAISNAKGEHHG